MDTGKVPRCRQCGSADARPFGLIPDADVFAGQQLVPPWSGGSLFRCGICHLGFRHPVKSENEYERLYAAASDAVWVSQGLRSDQLRVNKIISSAISDGSVLDVGCYDGVFLQSLPPRLRKYGVEASRSAAKVARTRGIEIIAENISDLPSLNRTFDVICAVDVIEHTINPIEFIGRLTRLLNPGGFIVISTGAMDTPAWRLAGGRYWYCEFPEHISFISPRWADIAADQLGLTVTEVQRFSYKDVDRRALARDRRQYYSKVIRSNIKLWLASLPPEGALEVKAKYSYGCPGTFEDHFIFVLTRATNIKAAPFASET